MNILLLIDASVIFHSIRQKLDALDPRHASLISTDAYIQSALHWVNLGGFLSSNLRANVRAIWCLDSKPYWRNQLYEEYKSNRASASKDLDPIKNIFQQEKFASLAFDTFEADDILAAIIRLNLPVLSLIVTCDSDLLGLVNSKTFFLETYGRSPALRGIPEAYEWLKSRYKKASKGDKNTWGEFCALEHFQPSQIYEWKSLFGDSTDAIPRNYGYLSNLLQPPHAFDLMEERRFHKELKITLEYAAVQPSQSKFSMEDVESTLLYTGLPFPVARTFIDGSRLMPAA